MGCVGAKYSRRGHGPNKTTRVWSYYWRQLPWPQETFCYPLFMLHEVQWQPTTKVLLHAIFSLYSPSTSIKSNIPFSSFNSFYPGIHLTSIYPPPLLLPCLLFFHVFSSLVLYWNLVFSFGVSSLFRFVWKHQKVTMRLKVIPTLIAFLTFNIFITCSWTC